MSSRVLLVDADLGLLRRMRNASALEGGQVELLTAQTWDEALELLSIAEPALVVGAVSRTTSPEIDALRGLQARGLAVAAFGPDVPELVRVAASAGITAFICKPISPAAFFVRLQQLIRPQASPATAGLKGFALADLLQLVSLSRQSMTLRVRSVHGAGVLVVAEGTLVDASAGALRGLDAAVAILDWSDSEVSSSPELPPRSGWTLDLSLMELLVDAARLRDEQRRDDAKQRLEALVSESARSLGVLAVALIHLASRSEVIGEGTALGGREQGRDLMLDALGLGEGDDAGPTEVQLSFEHFDLLGCRLAGAGVAMLVWCEPGELISGTQLALRHVRAQHDDGLVEAFSTVGVEVEPDDAFELA